MDELAFQQELINLKARVSQMASMYQYRLSPALGMPSGDPFCDQLQDIKARLQSMQATLDYLNTTRNHRMLSPMHSSDKYATNDFSLPHSRLALPSGPLFWQLFSSLRTDVRGLDNRVSNVEQELSTLEDRVDGMDQYQITPPGSASNIEFENALQQAYSPTSGTEPNAHMPWNSAADLQSHWPLNPDQNIKWYEDYQDFDTAPEAIIGPGQDGKDVGASVDIGKSSLPAPEGVLFRDREILQLEELLRGTQDSLNHRDAQIEELNAERRSTDARLTELEGLCSEREDAVRRSNDMIAEQRCEIVRLQRESQSKDAALQAWAAKHCSVQQTYLRKKTQLAEAGQHIQQLQHALYDAQCSKRDEVDSKNGEIQRLEEFCDAKEAVVHRQEQIIARGATLMEGKDDEIDRVSRRCKLLYDDYNNELREKARYVRLLDERDEQIERLQRPLKAAKQKRRESDGEDGVVASESLQHPMDIAEGSASSPFATAGSSEPSPTTAQWTPRAIDNYARMPHEEQRASAWNQDRSSPVERYKFGVAGAFGPPSHRRPSRSSHGEGRDLRRKDSLKLLKRLALAEEGASRVEAQQESSESSRRAGRSRLPLDDMVSRPPLPAPIVSMPRRATSAADLRSGSEGVSDRRRPMSRHESVQDLPRRRNPLQAYVEEGENEHIGDASNHG